MDRAEQRRDLITIVPMGAPDSEDGNLVYTRQGTPLQLTALLDPGSAEVRYIAGQSHAALARATVKITAAIEATLSAAAEATAGSAVSVTWQGPNNEGDFITIVPQKAGDSDYDRSAPTRDGSPWWSPHRWTPVMPNPLPERSKQRVLARRAMKILPRMSPHGRRRGRRRFRRLHHLGRTELSERLPHHCRGGNG